MSEPTVPPTDRQDAFGLAAALFVALSLFYWISLSPFVDLTGDGVFDPSAGASNRLNQVVTLGLFAGILLHGYRHDLRAIMLAPRALLLPLFAWLLYTSAASVHPELGVKGIILALMVAINASVFLLLPASERQFARLTGACVLVMLAVAYYGVIFLPTLSIHQASELREPMNAGFWRGHFPHKNSAAAAMVLAAFVGLYAWSAWSRLAGAAILVLSVVFLAHTGGKTATAMLPATVLVALAFERLPVLRLPIVVGGVALFNLLTVGAAVIKPLSDLIASFGIDATFTNRADIWRFAFTALARHPLTGYGFHAFWQTPELVYSGGSVETWAVDAENGHNSYLDIALAAGLPGLLLTVLWLIILPLRRYAALRPENRHTPLTRLYTQIWLYAMFNAGLESLFYEGGSVLWFAFIFSIYGLRLQSGAVLVAPAAATANGGGVRE